MAAKKKAAAKKNKGCACVEKVNDALKEGNRTLDAVYILSKDVWVAQVTTRSIGAKRGAKAPPALIATFCPFCGVAYP